MVIISLIINWTKIKQFSFYKNENDCKCRCPTVWTSNGHPFQTGNANCVTVPLFVEFSENPLSPFPVKLSSNTTTPLISPRNSALGGENGCPRKDQWSEIICRKVNGRTSATNQARVLSIGARQRKYFYWSGRWAIDCSIGVVGSSVGWCSSSWEETSGKCGVAKSLKYNSIGEEEVHPHGI